MPYLSLQARPLLPQCLPLLPQLPHRSLVGLQPGTQGSNRLLPASRNIGESVSGTKANSMRRPSPAATATHLEACKAAPLPPHS